MSVREGHERSAIVMGKKGRYFPNGFRSIVEISRKRHEALAPSAGGYLSVGSGLVSADRWRVGLLRWWAQKRKRKQREGAAQRNNGAIWGANLGATLPSARSRHNDEAVCVGRPASSRPDQSLSI